MNEVEYEALVLRLWWDESAPGPRASLTRISDRRVWVFADLEQLSCWITEHFGERPWAW